MTMDLRQLEARIRQLYALDRNALEMYSSMSVLEQDENIKSVLVTLSREEARHMQYSKEILQLLGCE